MANRTTGAHEDVAEPGSVDLRDYAGVVRRRRAGILAWTLACAALAVGYGLYAGPTYSATAIVDVQPLTLGPATSAEEVPLLESMGTQQAIAQSAPVVKQAAALLGVPEPALQSEAAKRLTVTVPTQSTDLQFTWKASTGAAAQAGANAFARAYLAYRHTLLSEQITAQLASASAQLKALSKQAQAVSAQMLGKPRGSAARTALAVRLRSLTTAIASAQGKLNTLPAYDTTGGQVTPAGLPLSPGGLGKKVLLVVGAVLGLVIGLVWAVIRDALDDRLYDPDQFSRSLAAGTLATLPPAAGRGGDDPRDAAKRPPAMIAEPGGTAAEAVRELRAMVVATAVRTQLRSLVVTSADPSVSAGRIAAELGVAFAESGLRVLLVGADLRGSALARIFDVPDAEGLTNVLAAGGDLLAYARQPRRAAGAPLPPAVADRLAVLPGGARLAASGVGVNPAAMAALVERQAAAFDVVVVEAPPAGEAADALALAAASDGVLVVAAEKHTTSGAVRHARARLDQVGARVIGGVYLGSAVRPGRRRPAPPPAAAGQLRPQPADPPRHQPSAPPATRPMPTLADGSRAGDGARSERAAKHLS